MKSLDAIEQLRAELRHDLQFIELNAKKNREMMQRVERRASVARRRHTGAGCT